MLSEPELSGAQAVSLRLDDFLRLDVMLGLGSAGAVQVTRPCRIPVKSTPD